MILSQVFFHGPSSQVHGVLSEEAEEEFSPVEFSLLIVMDESVVMAVLLVPLVESLVLARNHWTRKVEIVVLTVLLMALFLVKHFATDTFFVVSENVRV